MKILIRGQNEKDWHMVESGAYGNEAALQRLLSESPGLISIDEVRPEAGPLVLAVEEFPLSIGSVDLLVFTAGGDIAIIECKLAANPEVKRKVIGQVIEYGANLWEIDYEDLDNEIKTKTGENLAELVKNSVQSPEWDEEGFRRKVTDSLITGNFMLIIVVDEINEELSRIVRFINACGHPAFEFAALEMRRFHAESTEILVPRVFGPVRAVANTTRNGPGKQWDEQSFFEELIPKHGEEAGGAARRILEWAQAKMLVWYGRGRILGSFVPYFEHNNKNHQLFAVYTFGSVETYFREYTSRPPFDQEEKRIELMNKLNEIDGVSIPKSKINLHPSIPLIILAKGDSLEKFLAVYDWLVEEILSS